MYHCLHNRGSLTRALFVRNVGLVQFTRARRAHRSLRCLTRYKGSPQHSRHPSRPFISMPFSFSFRFSVPGITNPFASSSAGRRQPETEDQSTSHSGLAQTQLPSPIDSSWASIPAPAYRRRPSPSPASSDTKRSYSPAPLVRKRGWVPSSAEPSHAVMTASTSSGFLDTPAKYRDMAEQDERDDIDTEEVVVGTSDACLTSGRCMFFCRHLLLFFQNFAFAFMRRFDPCLIRRVPLSNSTCCVLSSFIKLRSSARAGTRLPHVLRCSRPPVRLSRTLDVPFAFTVRSSPCLQPFTLLPMLSNSCA